MAWTCLLLCHCKPSLSTLNMQLDGLHAARFVGCKIEDNAECCTGKGECFRDAI
jgi:hypothetical protein